MKILTEKKNDLVENLKIKIKTKKEELDSLSNDLKVFLEEWDRNYERLVSPLWLFNTQAGLSWSDEQKQYACKVLYNSRGRLNDFLWHLGNIAPNKKAKDLVLYNFSEEFGGNSPSHEELYFYFAKDMGLSPKEVTDEKYCLDFFKVYNKAQLDWLKSQDWDHCISAFSAYERLDNIDYANLHVLAKNLGASNRGLIFFKTHSEVEHFSATVQVLNEVWSCNPEAVKKAFAFISELQSEMWENVSNTIFEFLEK